MSVVNLFDLGVNLPDLMGPPPAGLQRIEATRQNTLVINDGDHFRVSPPRTHGGPAVWRWHLVNIGPGIVFVRWDGLGYADNYDPNSLYLAASSGFADFDAAVLTFSCSGGSTIAFAADNMPFTR